MRMAEALLFSVALLEPAAGPEQPAIAAEEVQVPLAQFRLRRFRVLGDDVVFLQGRRRQWYRATLVGPCYGLRGAMTIRFDTYGSSTLDNTSSIIAGGESCRIHSLTLSGPPPRRAR